MRRSLNMTDVVPTESAALARAPLTIDRIVLAVFGVIVLISLLLVLVASKWWLLLTAFVGAQMLQSAFTGYCPLAKALRLVGVRPGAAF
jgi:hypothetical protein